MASTEQKQAIAEALRAALDVENAWTEERSSYGNFLCHECGARTSSDKGGCVASECWIWMAERLLQTLEPAQHKREGEST